MKEFTIDASSSGMRLSRFVEKKAPSLPLSAVYKAIRTKKIKLNRKRCHPEDRLAEGDIVQFWLDDSSFEDKRTPDFMRASRHLDVLYEDGQLAILYKPSGISSHPYSGDYSDNLIARFLRYLYEKGEYSVSATFTPALCNRLDRNTSGLVIAGKTHEAVEAVNALIRDGSIRKTYLAVTVAKPPREGIYEAYLRKDEKKNMVAVSDSPKDGWQKIITGFRTVTSASGLWLAECTLYTGRTHQIRAHLAHLGSPILGDSKYGDQKINRKHNASRQYLTAYSISFPESGAPALSGVSGKTVSLAEKPFTDLFSY